jgi:hypothetical protein
MVIVDEAWLAGKTVNSRGVGKLVALDIGKEKKVVQVVYSGENSRGW